MTPTFNLLDQPWIPCALSEDDRTVELSLRDVFARASEIRAIVDASPLVTVALHRLLLAILHRNFGPRDRQRWDALRDAGCFDMTTLDAYFDRWHGRFDLFDPSHPFYQTPEIEVEYAKPVGSMVYGMTLGNYVTLFDHTTGREPVSLVPAAAARHLIAFQSFALGGLVSLRKGEPVGQFKSADAAPLAKGAVSLVQGGTLFETLLLNLHQYDPAYDVPFATIGDDAPAWERDRPTQAEDRRPAGYVDLLTWQSRRMRLVPETATNGCCVVRSVVIMKGNQFPGDWQLAEHETMLAFRKQPKAKQGTDPYSVLSLRPDRALWRDSLALYQSVEERTVRPKMQDWLAELVRTGLLHRTAQYTIDVFGLSIDRASVFLWRHERFPLPLRFLDDNDLLHAIGMALAIAERIGRQLLAGFVEGKDKTGKKISVPTSMQVFAENLASPSDDVRANPDAVAQIVNSLAPARIYWSRIEVPFKQFLIDLAAHEPEEALQRWNETVHRTARTAFAEAMRGFDTSHRELKAVARAQRQFNINLTNHTVAV